MLRHYTESEAVYELLKEHKYNYTRKDINALESKYWRSKAKHFLTKSITILGASIGLSGFLISSSAYLLNNNPQIVQAEETDLPENPHKGETYRIPLYFNIYDQTSKTVLRSHIYGGYVILGAMSRGGTTPILKQAFTLPQAPNGYHFIKDYNSYYTDGPAQIYQYSEITLTVAKNTASKPSKSHSSIITRSNAKNGSQAQNRAYAPSEKSAIKNNNSKNEVRGLKKHTIPHNNHTTKHNKNQAENPKVSHETKTPKKHSNDVSRVTLGIVVIGLLFGCSLIFMGIKGLKKNK